MGLPEVRMSFADRVALERELETNLKHGRAFLTQANDVPVLSECVLVLVHPEHKQELRLSAQVVMVNDSGPACGMGIALRALGPEGLAELLAFASRPAANTDTGVTDTPPLAAKEEADALAMPAAPAADSSTRWTTLSIPATALDYGVQAQAAPHIETETPALGDAAEASAQPTAASEADGLAAEAGPPDDPPLQASALDAAPAAEVTGVALAEGLSHAAASAEANDAALSAEDAGHEDDASADDLGEQELAAAEQLALGEEQELSLGGRSTELQREQRQHKLRQLNPGQQQKLARTGELSDRVAIERLYGKGVWEALLHNPRLSIPEVARIARKGTVPRPLLELILDNGSWIKASSVRRALLSNPKLGADAVLKLLRATPKHELKLIEKGTAYGAGVREAARKLLRQQG